MDNERAKKTTELDVNEALEQIFMSEENILEENYQKGFEIGKSQGNTEAYHLGYHRASEIGAELGYYFAIIKTHQLPHTSSDRLKRLITDLEQKILNFPRSNDPNVDIIGSVTEIRSKFRQICAGLKISSKYPESTNLSF
uniref:CSON015562 protein n=1 Tax=Culicoides sonorensis TaxID=179676 RepID=A0A336MDQ9_CULSO